MTAQVTMPEVPKATDQVLETGASLTQDFEPLKAICAHLNAFHVYADEPSRTIQADHYCCHIDKDVRQCLIYESSDRKARLVGVEYIITAALFATLPVEEKKLWHSHDYEVRSGMLIMPNRNVPDAIWEAAETKEMEQLVGTYGKTWQLWQTDRGDRIPLGGPQLMGSFMADEHVPWAKVKERDEKFGVDTQRKKEIRKHIEGTDVDGHADQCWKDNK